MQLFVLLFPLVLKLQLPNSKRKNRKQKTRWQRRIMPPVSKNAADRASKIDKLVLLISNISEIELCSFYFNI